MIFWLITAVTKVRRRIEALAKAEEKKAEEAKAAPAPATPVTPEDIALLREIRDLLKEKAGGKSA